jgi:hypothetical protein
MANKRSSTKPDRESAPESNQPAWRLPEGAAATAPRSRNARWLLILAIFLQIAWIAALVGMAVFVRWKK